MKLPLRYLIWSGLLLAVSCGTIHIYFPAEEIRGVADRIVDEVYGEPDKPVDKVPAKPGSSFFRVFEPTVAYAAQDLDVTTPEIRAIKADMTARFDQLVPFLNSGQAGITSDGLLEIRTAEGLGMKERAELTRLIKAENQDRLRLYKEIATANNFPDKVDEIQAIFASSWRDKAHKGWYVQGDKGDWKVK